MDKRSVPSDEEFTDEERQLVEQQRGEIRDFVRELRLGDIKSGNWFEKLLAKALHTYTRKATWEHFKEQFPGVPADAIVEKRIAMAARYAAIEGGLSASAFTGVVAATIGSGGAASPLTVPAGVSTFMVDVAFITQLQIRLAYDIAVLYRVPIDVDDPDDLWKLVKIAFAIRAGELASSGAMKAVPAIVRPLVKRFISGATLTAAKNLPVIGRFLLQRNFIKFGIPLVGIPLSVTINYFSTILAGRYARTVLREQAQVTETAERLMERSEEPRTLLWLAWLTINADGKIGEAETLLMQQLTQFAHLKHEITDLDLEKVIDLDPEDVWARIDLFSGSEEDLIAAATTIASVDGSPNASEKQMLDALRKRLQNRPGPVPV